MIIFLLNMRSGEDPANGESGLPAYDPVIRSTITVLIEAFDDLAIPFDPGDVRRTEVHDFYARQTPRLEQEFQSRTGNWITMCRVSVEAVTADNDVLGIRRFQNKHAAGSHRAHSFIQQLNQNIERQMF